jgi:hypothetical protein
MPLPPWVIQSAGLLLIFFFVAFWALTGRVEPTLFGGAGVLVGIGEYQKAKRATDATPKEPPP